MYSSKPITVAFIYNKGRMCRADLVEEGSAPSEFFFGVDLFRQHGHKVIEFEVDVSAESQVLLGRVADILTSYELWPMRAYGGLISNLWNLSDKLKECDIVVATTSGIAFSLEMLRTLRRFNAPIVGIHCGLLNYNQTWMRRKLSSFLLRKMWTVLYGEGELPGMKTVFNISGNRIEVNQFGVDVDFWRPSHENDEGYVLSVGNDGRRDYDLLMRVAGQVDRKFIIVSILPVNENIPENVKLIRGHWHSEILSDKEMRHLYQNARCVVVPLIETKQPSGQSVVLQAMACGKPVILSKTQGLWSQHMLVHGKNIVFVKPGNKRQLIDAITDLASDNRKCLMIGRNACNTVRENATIEAFGERLLNLCEKIVYSKDR